MNSSIKSCHNEEASQASSPASPSRVTLNVPSSQQASLPADISPPPPPSPPPLHTTSLTLNEHKVENHYSLLLSLQEVQKKNKALSASVSPLPNVSDSPIKSSDAELSAAGNPDVVGKIEDVYKSMGEGAGDLIIAESVTEPGNLASSVVSEIGKDTREADVSCQICDKVFKSRSTYRRHLMIHQGVYTHICAVCTRKFRRKEHFDRHKCNRKAKISNRVEKILKMCPDTILPSNKVPVVAYPPILSGMAAQHSASVPASITAAEVPSSSYSTAMMIMPAAPTSFPAPSKQQQYGEVQRDDERAPRMSKKRRKKAQPRRSQPNNAFMEDVEEFQAYESPVPCPITIQATCEVDSVSPQDLNMKPLLEQTHSQIEIVDRYESMEEGTENPIMDESVTEPERESLPQVRTD